jgi:hypothetical protein
MAAKVKLPKAANRIPRSSRRRSVNRPAAAPAVRRTRILAAAEESHAAGRDWKSVRAERLARARKLIARKSYPSKRVLKAVANLLARHLGR